MSARFYDDLAEDYHLIFADWNAAIRRQGNILSALLPPPDEVGCVLDCACGIGTQALALAGCGYRVEGSDVSRASIDRARREAAARGLDIPLRIDDMRTLEGARTAGYGAVVCMDNALPHLGSDAELAQALRAMRARLRDGGTLLVSLRDYGAIMRTQPNVIGPVVHGASPTRRLVHQVWHWDDDRRYTTHLVLTRERAGQDCDVRMFTGHYRAVAPSEVAGHTEVQGFAGVDVLPVEATGFYQPIVCAVAPASVSTQRVSGRER